MPGTPYNVLSRVYQRFPPIHVRTCTSQISQLLLHPSLWLLVSGLSSHFCHYFPYNLLLRSTLVSIILKCGYKILYASRTLLGTDAEAGGFPCCPEAPLPLPLLSHTISPIASFLPTVEQYVLINTWIDWFFKRFLLLQTVKVCLDSEIECHCMRNCN